jgi:hypothetical protein
MTDKPSKAYPRRMVYRHGAYRVVIWCYAASPRFFYAYAQRGDLLGSITITGPGARLGIQAGCLLHPINLSNDVGDTPARRLKANMATFRRRTMPPVMADAVDMAMQHFQERIAEYRHHVLISL